MSGSRNVPAGFAPLDDGGPFVDMVGPVYSAGPGVLGIRVEGRHLNRAGTAMGGFLVTLVDVALGRAIREEAHGDTSVATVSLTADYLRPASPGVWLEARTEVERLGGRLAFADCSVRGGDEEIVRARAVFAVRPGEGGG